jgi:2-polyprenyl-6-methoxyphenol hydroxylase-like FAD-dependent oxidoreductase
VPELLEQVQTSDDLFFDSVSQVRVPRWSQGRVGLVGDAAACVALFGDGSSLAIAGAATLADSLAESQGDPSTAFDRYQATHGALVAPRQRNVGQAARLLIPATAGGILTRNLATRLWPVAAGIQSLRRGVTSARAQRVDLPETDAAYGPGVLHPVVTTRRDSRGIAASAGDRKCQFLDIRSSARAGSSVRYRMP